MILPIIGCILFIVAVLALCFRMERERGFRLGYTARGHDVAARTFHERRAK